MTIVVTMNADDEIAELLSDIVEKVASSTSSSSLMSRRNDDTSSISVDRMEGVNLVALASPVRRSRHTRVQSDPQQALFLTPPAEDDGRHQSLNNSFEQEENQWLTDSWRQAKQSLIDARLHDLEVSRELERVCTVAHSVSSMMFLFVRCRRTRIYT